MQAMDTNPDSEPSAHNIGMDIEDGAGSGPVVGGMIVDDDISCVLHHPIILLVQTDSSYIQASVAVLLSGVLMRRMALECAV